MEKLIFDTGIQSFEVNGGELLQFNPSDPNVYSRFMSTSKEISKLEDEFAKKVGEIGGDDAAELLTLIKTFDNTIKEKLSYIFGSENNFDKMIGGVSLMAVASNGERVLTNLLSAIQPIIESGAQRHMENSAQNAVEQAQVNRAQRRAGK